MPEWDLTAISHAMHTEGGFADPTTGQVKRAAGTTSSTWIAIPTAGADADLREMEAFVGAVADPESHMMLDNALSSGAFRGAVVADRELDRAWGRFRDAHRRGRAVDWLTDRDLITAPDAARLRRETDAAARSALAVVNADANAELRGVEALEEELQTPERRRDDAWLAVILADDFEHIDASGRLYPRREALAALEDLTLPIVPLRDISSRRLGVDSVLVRWRSDAAEPAGGQATVRTSLWRMDPAGWRLAHHQATPVR